ncbi:MAG: T9SS type A sorting domain-containing protein [Flavobacteriales bacterium]|nr:T9SS type A sorting domain-containing protein [Flavobacteriales bacterium]
MRKLSTSVLLLLSLHAFGGGHVTGKLDPAEKTPFNAKWMPDKYYQAELRQQAPWQRFLQRNGDWWVMFNEENRKPHRAFGTPIMVNGASVEDKARNFISGQLSDFRIPVSELVLAGITSNEKHHFVNFTQVHNGYAVLESRLTVKITNAGEVIMFGADVYDQIQAPASAALNANGASSYAMAGIPGTISNVQVDNNLFIFPIPKDKSYEFKLVYKVNVETIDEDQIPSNYLTYIDATSGDVIYRQNTIQHFHHGDNNKTKKRPVGIDVTTTGQVYTTHSYNPATTEILPNLDFTISANNFTTDGAGFSSTGIAGPQTGTFFLKGDWSTVFTNNVTPSFTFGLVDGANAVDFTGGNIRERSAYYHVNVVHDHMKSVMPTFTGMDFSLPTNVDLTTGNCNAFYNGTSINFYAQANGCTSFATVGDVVYHEYGHGINDNFYTDNGGNFVNGAMGEGYADFWAFSITENAVLGYGTDNAVATDYIRRYDQDRKVYPINIVGEVHSDGEIIAGAWWDTYLNLGSDMNHTLQLFVAAYPGLQAQTFNGNEGKAYTDVLIDVLQADDDDANLLNGTPNGQAIVDAFYLHGITLISNATLNHTSMASHIENDPITINATLSLNFPYTDYLNAVKLFYKINNGTYNAVAMTNSGGNNYTYDIPSQPIGTVVSYYLGAEDINSNLTAVIPIGAEAVDPNIPYFILVGYALKKTDDVADFLNELGTWQTGLVSDNNTTGDWVATIPIGSFSTAGDTSTAVQPYYQHTPAGEFCFVTGNAATSSDAIGTADVDGGHTTLQSANINMTPYTNPAVTYYRWYINNPPSGANPNADWWQVSISNDGGTTWVPVENTKTSDRSWRRYAFRVADYVTPTATVKIRFVASDSTHLGQNLDGGSLVEAAVDDIQIWDNVNVNEVNEINPDGFQFFLTPNPSKDMVNLTFELVNGGDVQIHVSDVSGKVVYNEGIKGLAPGLRTTRLETNQFTNGVYYITITSGRVVSTRKLVVMH